MKNPLILVSLLPFLRLYVSSKMHNICIQKCTKIRSRDKLYTPMQVDSLKYDWKVK